MKLVRRLTDLFPVWVTLAAVIALIYPPAFTWFRGGAITWTLGIIMLGMGVTLRFADFKDVLKTPGAIGLGVAAQYLIMPFLGWLLAAAFALPPALAAGLILVASCPGGTASNVVTYLARANVALSVLMTMCSTFAAVIMTPLLTSWLAGAYVPVDGWGLLQTTAQVVLIPVLLGMALHHLFPRQIEAVKDITPLISVIGIVLIVGTIIGQGSGTLLQSGARLVAAVFLLHASGFALGYLAAWLFKYDTLIRRTISIEVGMQNSGLGVVLARAHFANPLTAVPAAIASVFHSVIGSALAACWRLRCRRDVMPDK